MLYGIGCDLCELAHLEKSLTGAHAAAFVRRVYGETERAALGLDAPPPPGAAQPTGWPVLPPTLPPRKPF